MTGRAHLLPFRAQNNSWDATRVPSPVFTERNVPYRLRSSCPSSGGASAHRGSRGPVGGVRPTVRTRGSLRDRAPQVATCTSKRAQGLDNLLSQRVSVFKKTVRNRAPDTQFPPFHGCPSSPNLRCVSQYPSFDRTLDAHALVGLLDEIDALVFAADGKSLAVKPMGVRAVERFGHGRDATLPADQFWRSVPLELRAELLELLRAVAADGVARSMEHPMMTVAGTETWYRTTVKRSPTGDPENMPLLGVMVDITDCRRVEAQRSEFEARLSMVGETSEFDLWICAPDGKCVLQNRHSRRRHGDMVGKVNPHWSRCMEVALRGTKTREEVASELEGSPRHHLRVVSPVQDNGVVRAVIGVEFDITDLKHNEKKLQKSLNELSGAQDSLVQREQRTAMGEMSALVAHEVRNPLGAISNAVTLLRKRARPGDVELCTIIDEEVTKLNRLVGNLLDSVRPMSVDLKPMPLGEVVEEALARSLRADGRVAGIRVHRFIDATLPLIPVDSHLFGMALRNVFQNALQAMPRSGDIFLTIKREFAYGRLWTRVSVRDSGPGIPQDVQSRLFEPFVTTRPSGSGLGLTIVRRVLEAHRGRVEFSSEPGRGTTCTLRLPASPQPD